MGRYTDLFILPAELMNNTETPTESKTICQGARGMVEMLRKINRNDSITC